MEFCFRWKCSSMTTRTWSNAMRTFCKRMTISTDSWVPHSTSRPFLMGSTDQPLAHILEEHGKNWMSENQLGRRLATEASGSDRRRALRLRLADSDPIVMRRKSDELQDIPLESRLAVSHRWPSRPLRKLSVFLLRERCVHRALECPLRSSAKKQ